MGVLVFCSPHRICVFGILVLDTYMPSYEGRHTNFILNQYKQWKSKSVLWLALRGYITSCWLCYQWNGLWKRRLNQKPINLVSPCSINLTVNTCQHVDMSGIASSWTCYGNLFAGVVAAESQAPDRDKGSLGRIRYSMTRYTGKVNIFLGSGYGRSRVRGPIWARM